MSSSPIHSLTKEHICYEDTRDQRQPHPERGGTVSNKAINWAHSLKGKGGYKNVLIAMGDSANQYMATWPSRETLSKRTGLSEDTVKDHQAKAVANGDLILVPWQTDNGADASPAYFLGYVRELFDELPPLEVAFAKRINFKGPRKGGRPRDYIPSWWSGEKIGSGHRCTCCGGVCNGSSEADATTAAEAEEVAPEGYPEPLGLHSDEAIPHPGEGGGFSTLEGGISTTQEGGVFPHPFNPQQGKPSVVTPQPRANAEAFARPSSLDSQAGLSPGGGSGGRVETDAANPAAASSGLPAGHGAKTAPRERMASNQQPEPMPPLRLSPQEKRQRERSTIQAAIAALESTLGLEEATRVMNASLATLERADEAAAQSGRAEAQEAIVEPGWTVAGTTRRYDADVAARALRAALGARPLARWPKAVLEPLGLASGGVVAA